MLRFLVRRALLGVAIVFTVVTVTFALIHAAPGEPFAHMLQHPGYTPELRAKVRAQYGLDRPLPEQYIRYLSIVARGDLGDSFSLQRPVREVIAEALPRSALLIGVALAIGFATGIGLGAVQGARLGSGTDRLIGALTVALSAVPEFWLALGLLLFFALRLGLLPTTGMVDESMHDYLSPAGQVLDVMRHMVLPVASLAFVIAAFVARVQRAAIVDALPEDFVRTARAKGASERSVVLRHALRNALLPTITLLGLALPSLVGGAVFIEAIYSWPGMGRAAVDAITSRDYPVVLGVVIVSSVFVVIGSLIADVLYVVADPRLRRA